MNTDRKIDQKELDALNLLGNMHKSLHTDRDLTNALDLLSTHTVNTLRVKGCSVKVLNERRTKLAIASIKGLSEEFIQGVGVYGMIKSPINRKALEGTPLYIGDINSSDIPNLPGELVKEGIQAIASVPISLEGQIFGVLSVYDDKVRTFDDSEKELIENLAGLTAAVIRSLRKFQRSQVYKSLVQSITTTLDLDTVLKEIVIRATQSMHCRAAFIRLFNESTNQLVFGAAHGLSQEYLEKVPKNLDLSPIDRRALENKETLMVEDMTKEPEIMMKEEAAREGLTTMVSAPMVVKDKSIGILKLYFSNPTTLTLEEITFIKTMAEISAVAVMNAQLYEKLHSLYQVTSSLSSTLESKRLLELISIHAADYMGAKGANILLWDKVHEKFSARASYRLSDDFIDELNITKKTWTAQETLKGNTIIIGNLEQEDRIHIKDICLKHDIKSMISIPLKMVDVVVGILLVFCRRERTFTPEEIEFLTALANHGAIALENAQMHEHFKNEYEKLVDDIYVWHDWTSYIIRE